MRKTIAAAATAAAIALTGCSSSSHHDGTHYASAQAIADKLEAAGFTVSMLHKSDISSPDMGMDAAYDFTVTEKPGPAPGNSGINMFRNHEALTMWTALSKGFGGIAVTGDTWAVSLATDNAKSVQTSKAMAPHMAQVLGGTVQE